MYPEAIAAYQRAIRLRPKKRLLLYAVGGSLQKSKGKIETSR